MTKAAAFGLLLLLVSPTTQPIERRTLLASIVGAGGRPLTGLVPDDFRLEQDGHPVDVLDVRVASYPLVMLVGTSGDQREFPSMRGAIGRFAGGLSWRGLSIVSFASRSVTIVPPTTDRVAIEAAVRSLVPHGGDQSNIIDAIVASRRAQAIPLLGVVVIAGPGSERSGHIVADLTAGQGHTVLHAIVRRELVINDPLAPGYDDRQTQTVDALRRIAARTAGSYTVVNGARNLQAALLELAARLDAEILLDYASPGSGVVQIAMRTPGATVRASDVTDASPR